MQNDVLNNFFVITALVVFEGFKKTHYVLKNFLMGHFVLFTFY